MKPFRTSFSARMVSISIATALIGGGFIAVLGVSVTGGVPLILLAAIGISIIGLVLGVNDYPGAVAVLSILLPVALLPYVMVLEVVATRFPSYGYALLVAGVIPLAMTLLASVRTTTERSQPIVARIRPASA